MEGHLSDSRALPGLAETNESNPTSVRPISTETGPVIYTQH